MKQVLLLIVLAMTGIACTDDGAAPSSDRASSPREQAGQAPASPTSPPEKALPREAEIYAAVIRQLASDKHLVERAEAIYVVDGAVSDAGNPRGNPFGPAPEPFGLEVVAGIRNQVPDKLLPLRFLNDGTEALRDPNRPGVMKNGAVLISLGEVDPANGRRVEVANTLWCGGKCSQWQTYVVSHRSGRWVVTGNSGSVVAS